MMFDKNRLTSLMQTLTEQTVLSYLLAPLQRALARVRPSKATGRVLSSEAFISLGVLRHLQGTSALRAQIQQLLHRDVQAVERRPVARSTCSDALASKERQGVLRAVVAELRGEAACALPDRLAEIPGLAGRPVRERVRVGTYQKESAHYSHRTPSQGGEDNP